MKDNFLKIGELSRKTNCHIETIRYYEKIKLLPLPQRSEGNYRLYTQRHLKQLKFILKARFLGFSLEHIRSLLELSTINNLDSCEKVQKLSQEHLNLINKKIKDLKVLKEKVEEILNCCQNNVAVCCPLLDKLFEE